MPETEPYYIVLRFFLFLRLWHRRAQCFTNLKRTDNFYGIVRVHIFCQNRICFAKHLIKSLCTFFFFYFMKLFSQCFIGCNSWHIIIFEQNTKIKSCSSGNHRDFIMFKKALYHLWGFIRKISHSKLFNRFNNIHKMMFYSLHLFFRGFCRCNIKLFIYLPWISRNNFRIKNLCYLNSQSCFSGSGRPCNCYYIFFICFRHNTRISAQERMSSHKTIKEARKQSTQYLSWK